MTPPPDPPDAATDATDASAASHGGPDRVADPRAGRGIVRASVLGTAIFTVLTVAAVVSAAAEPLYVVVSLAMFFVGSAAFVVAFLTAVGRSREEAIGIGGLFFGAGTTPVRVQVALMVSLGVQVVVSVVAAVVRLYTAVAFGTLAPMWALGLAGLWVARHGVFPPRPPEPTREARRAADRAQHRRGALPAPPSGPVEAAE